MNRLQYRHAFAMRYFKRTGNYMIGWLLSKVAADRARIKAKNKVFVKKFAVGWPPKPMYYFGCSPGVINKKD